MEITPQNHKDDIWLLEGDGFIDKLLNLLWLRDPIFGTIPSISVPDTVIFNHGSIENWFFVQEQQIKKKLRSSCTLENIERVFSKKVPAKGGFAAMFIEIKGTEANRVEDMTFHYILKDELGEFLKRKSLNGILQRFIQPKGEYNYILSANWSENLCLLERIENVTKISDRMVEPYVRAMTIEGKEHQKRTTPVRGYVLPHQIEKMCEMIVHHVRNVSLDRMTIGRMRAIFKVDENERIWFLYASSLRLNQTEKKNKKSKSMTDGLRLKIENTDIKLNVPSNINAFKPTVKKIRSLKKDSQCQSCHKFYDKGELLKITLSQLIRGYDENHFVQGSTTEREAQSKKSKKTESEEPTWGILHIKEEKPIQVDMEPYNIPKLIRHLYPKIKEKEYAVLKYQPGFLNQEAWLCQNCYVDISKCNALGGDQETAIRRYMRMDFKGCDKLKPEVTRKRTEMTMSNIKSPGSMTVDTFRRTVNHKIHKSISSPYSVKQSQSAKQTPRLFFVKPRARVTTTQGNQTTETLETGPNLFNASDFNELLSIPQTQKSSIRNSPVLKSLRDKRHAIYRGTNSTVASKISDSRNSRIDGRSTTAQTNVSSSMPRLYDASKLSEVRYQRASNMLLSSDDTAIKRNKIGKDFLKKLPKMTYLNGLKKKLSIKIDYDGSDEKL